MRYTVLAFLFVFLFASCGVEGFDPSGSGQGTSSASSDSSYPDTSSVTYEPITELPNLGGPCYDEEGNEVCQAQRLCDFVSQLVVNDVLASSQEHVPAPCSVKLLIECKTSPRRPFPPSVEAVEQRRVKIREDILGRVSDFCRRYMNYPDIYISESCKYEVAHPYAARDFIIESCLAQE